MTTALITGAGSGLGAEFAAQLAERGHNLVLVGRRATKLEAVAEPLRARHGVQVEVLPADLADRTDLARVARRILEPASAESGSGPIDLLINNAGSGPVAEFLDADIIDEEAMHAVMTTAVLVLSHAAARTMREQGRGAIVTVASIAAYIPGGTYSADKAWALAFTEALAAELHGTGVTATAIAPGYVHTDFHETAGWDNSGSPAFAWLDSPRVVSEALAGARAGQAVVVPSVRYRAVAAFVDSIPRPLLRRAVAWGRRTRLLTQTGSRR